MKHANSIVDDFEYFCQMSSKSILIILSYTVQSLVIFETRCSTRCASHLEFSSPSNYSRKGQGQLFLEGQVIVAR